MSGRSLKAIKRGTGDVPKSTQIRAPEPGKATPTRTPGLANKGAARDLFRHQGSGKAARIEND